MVATAMTGRTHRASAAGSFLVLLLVVALAGVASATTAAFSGGGGGDSSSNNAAALLTTTAPSASAASPAELNGFMQCLMGCFTQVFSCSFGCMGKTGLDLPLCIVSCDQKSVVCMIQCGLSPPKPSPPGPKPPSPGPKPPKPPTPAPPGPPAVTGRKAMISA